MNWTQLLKSEIETACATTARLLDKADPESLDWKPESGGNWMTVGQFLKHITNACGAGCKGSVTSDWGLPAGKKLEDLSPEEALPPAEKMPAVESVEEAKNLPTEDKIIALEMVHQAGEDDLANREIACSLGPRSTLAPRPASSPIGAASSTGTKASYATTSSYQGKPVNTTDLWGQSGACCVLGRTVAWARNEGTSLVNDAQPSARRVRASRRESGGREYTPVVRSSGRGQSARAEPTHSLAVWSCVATIYFAACSHSPQMLPCGSMMAATAPTPGTGIFGSATVAPSFVAFSIAASMLATST